MFQKNRRSKSKQKVIIIITIYLCGLSEKIYSIEWETFDAGEVNWFWKSYFFNLGNSKLLGIKKYGETEGGEYLWEAVLSRNNKNWLCENLLKINLMILKFNKNCIHLCLFLLLYTSCMRTMVQIKKFNLQFLECTYFAQKIKCWFSFFCHCL